MRRTAALLVLVALTGACSVTTPRREAGFVRATDGAATAAGADGVPSDGEVLGGTETAAASGSSTAGGPSGAGVRASAGGAAARTNSAGGTSAATATGPVTGVTRDTVAVSV